MRDPHVGVTGKGMGVGRIQGKSEQWGEIDPREGRVSKSGCLIPRRTGRPGSENRPLEFAPAGSLCLAQWGRTGVFSVGGSPGGRPFLSPFCPPFSWNHHLLDLGWDCWKSGWRVYSESEQGFPKTLKSIRWMVLKRWERGNYYKLIFRRHHEGNSSMWTVCLSFILPAFTDYFSCTRLSLKGC